MEEKTFIDDMSPEEFSEAFEAWNRSAIDDPNKTDSELKPEERAAKRRELSRIIDPNGYFLPFLLKYAED